MSEVVTLDQVRAQLLPTPFARPEDIIASAADLSTLDHLQRLSGEAMDRLDRPLLPSTRRRLRRAVEALEVLCQ